MTQMPPVDEQMRLLRRGVSEILPEAGLEKKLRKALESQTPLRVKEGFDASAPDLHLGHTVQLRKLRQFQDLGHQVLFLIGDFTAMIGDPSGKSETRPMLTREEVEANAESYRQQCFRVLDESRTEVVFNSEWCAAMNSVDVLRLASRYTVARMIERDDFHKRYQSGQPISIQEFLYPLFQGYDSVALQADVELGGTDQKFNLLVGRELQKQYGQSPQCVLTLPLLPGTDGVEKMSKSLGNAIGIEESPGEMFGKIMSIPDELMPTWLELISDLPVDELEATLRQLEAGEGNPSHHKRALARNIVEQYHPAGSGGRAEAQFDKLFVQKDEPDEIPAMTLPATDDAQWIVALMADHGLAASRGEARRLVQQGGVSINGEKVADIDLNLDASAGQSYRFKVGKRKFLDILFA
jgi:tyrosyl-tRNA synthetase